MSRESALASAVSPRRGTRAAREAERFASFCSAFGLDTGIESVSLYLAAHAGVETGQATRRRLQDLDLVKRLAGQTAWSADPDVRALIRGVNRVRPIGSPATNHVDPLYGELVRALIDATRAPSIDDRKAVAALILHAATGLPAAVLARLTWDQVRLTKSHVVVTVNQRVGRGAPTTGTWTLKARREDPACPVNALLPLRGSSYVLVEKPTLWNEARLRRSLHTYLSNDSSDVALDWALLEVGRGSPSRVRDRALLTLGYGAALRTYEASNLRRCDVVVSEGGLVCRVDGRRSEVAVPSVVDPRYDPVRAWMEWVALMDGQAPSDPDAPAFPTCNYSVIEGTALAAQGLNRVIHTWCVEAELRGRYAWTSLRSGLMRTAVRMDAPSWAIASRADLRSLGSVERHERRENLLRRNAATQLGL